jgi:hypothetical protein
MKMVKQLIVKKLFIINLIAVTAVELQLPPYRQAVIVGSNIIGHRA